MYGDNSANMPIGFAMALAHDKAAFYKFLNMSDSEQDALIEKANNSKNIVEMQRLVSSLSINNEKKEI
ncbi:MAG: hypothetical protein IJZ93_04720 [Clostridia bacterium]|nr:hypothetical protein [Clostridia bacterium]